MTPEIRSWNRLGALGILTFGRNSSIGESIRWLRQRPADNFARMLRFTQTNNELNGFMETGTFPPTISHGPELQANLSGVPIPSLQRVQGDYYLSDRVRLSAGNVLAHAREKYPGWAKVDPIYPSPATPAMGALIEGFGLYLRKLIYGEKLSTMIPALRRAYVLAFEETLLTYHPRSPLVRDLIGYIESDRQNFPEILHPIIDQTARKFYSLDNQPRIG